MLHVYVNLYIHIRYDKWEEDKQQLQKENVKELLPKYWIFEKNNWEEIKQKQHLFAYTSIKIKTVCLQWVTTA